MKKILIIQTAFIGDVVLATPILEKIYQFFPTAKIDFLVRKGNEALLNQHPFLNKVLIWNKKTSKYKNLFKLIQEVRSEKYDLIVNPQRFLSSGFLCAFSNAKVVVGFNKNPLSFTFSKSLPHELNGTHEVERNLSLIQHLTNNSFQMPKLYPTTGDSEKVETEIINKISKNQLFITIAPTSVWFTKQLPAKKWVELIQKLSPNIYVFLIGGPSDFEACEVIKNDSQNEQVHNLCGRLNLLASADLMSKANMNYANDSAPIHIASAMNAPMTAVFCSTVPKFGFTPLSDYHKIIETTEKLDCRPCGLHGKKSCPKGHFKCSNVNFNL